MHETPPPCIDAIFQSQSHNDCLFSVRLLKRYIIVIPLSKMLVTLITTNVLNCYNTNNASAS